jgi:hypothetical protein
MLHHILDFPVLLRDVRRVLAPREVFTVVDAMPPALIWTLT